LKENEPWPPTGWLARAPAFYSVISREVVVGPDVMFIPDNRAAAVEVTLLERRDASARPQIFAVAWPTAMVRDLDAPATPFLVFSTHELNQNISRFKHFDHYPDSWDYLHLAIYQYLNYFSDPLDIDHLGHRWRGICYQLSISQKRVVLVLP